jgi:tRNA A-37 threonylcarbamoyl transferase component Bud32
MYQAYAEEALQRHLGRPAERLALIPTYTDTIVYEAQFPDRSVIFKATDPAGRDPSRIALEAWACGRVRAIGVPAPFVVAVDTSATLFPSPYLIMQKMVGRPLTQLGLPVEQQRPYLQDVLAYVVRRAQERLEVS